MSRIPIRARLAVAFSAALVVVLALAAAFVLARVDADLTESTDEALASRLDALSTLVADSGPNDPPSFPREGTEDDEDNFSQILRPDGTVVASTLPASAGPALDAEEAAEAAQGEILVESRDIGGVDGDARLLAEPAAGPQAGGLILLAGTSNQDHEETLQRIATAFAVGAPVALVIAALAGYLLARRALRPVERMRAQAERIEPGSGDRLPIPSADDELKSLGLTLNSLLARQDEALERERAFVGDASHELRTPLSILRAELEVAELEGGSPEQLRAAVSGALREVDSLARLSDDLLVVATADRGRIPIHRERVGTKQLLERVATRFGRTAAGGGRPIEVVAEGDAECFVDPLRVEQAIGNLVDNSLRYGAGTVSLRARSTDGALEVVVEDDGDGFSADVAGRAFERFTRGSAVRRHEGAGLGLSIVRAIAQAHGGEASIEALAPPRVRVRFSGDGFDQSSSPPRSDSP